MKGTLWWAKSLGGSLMLATGIAAAQTPPPVPAPSPGPAAAANDGREVQALLGRMSDLSNAITRVAEAQVWRYQIAQADVALQLAVRSSGKEREDWLRMVVDNHYSASVHAPAGEPIPYQRLAQLPAYLARAFPGCQAIPYAALQEIQAEHARLLAGSRDNAAAQERLRARLLRFAQEYPGAADTPRVILEAGRLSEAGQKSDDAVRCYRYLMERHPTAAEAKKAAGALWRLTSAGRAVELKLPLLYPHGEGPGQTFDLGSVRGKVVVLYFWSCKKGSPEQDFAALRKLLSQHSTELELVHVNLDDRAEATAYLSGKLTVGTHVHQSGGLEGTAAASFGVRALPEVILVGKDGSLVKHSLDVARAAAEVERLLRQETPRKAGQ